MFERNSGKDFDFILFLAAIFIFGLGLFFLYSATYQQTAQHSLWVQNFVWRQILWFILGLFICLLVLKVDYQKWLELAYPLYVFTLFLLLLVLVLGKTRLGAQRWIGFGNLSFQPSEFSKLVIILTLARYLGQRGGGNLDLFWQQGAKGAKTLTISFLLCLIPFILTVKQPDLGTALALVPILFTLLYVWGVSVKVLFLLIGSGMLASPLLWNMLRSYQKRRILVFLNPNLDPLGAGYTVIQSKIAIGSGRCLGKGWLAGTQNQLNFLPERHTDFIFSVVGEEWGFLGALLVLMLYFILIWRGVICIQRAKSPAARLLACGIVVMFSFQVVVNMAMTMGLVPVVGLPLPLVSYGGSSLLTSMVAIALLLNVGMRS